MARFVWTALALMVFVAPASAQLLRRGNNNCCNTCSTPCVSQCGYNACGSGCSTGCGQQYASNCCNQGGVVRTGFFNRGNNNCCNPCGYVNTCGGCAGCGTVTPAAAPGAPAAKPMPSGAMMTPMQPIMQVGATMAPPVAGTKTEGTTPAATTTTATATPVMMANNNCCCDNYNNNMNNRGGMFRRGLVLRRW